MAKTMFDMKKNISIYFKYDYTIDKCEVIYEGRY